MDEAEFIPAVGRTVVYQVAQGQFRPAQIVHVWSIEGPKTCNLVVFVDGSNDLAHGGASNVLAVWNTSVMLGDDVGKYLPRVPAAAS